MQFKQISNKGDDTIANELKLNLDKNSKLSIISAYFTIYAFNALKDQLKNIEEMRFVYTEPTFIQSENDKKRQYQIEKNNETNLTGNEFELKLRNQMTGPAIAREAADWIKEKVTFKSIKGETTVSKKFIVENSKKEEKNLTILGEMDFTSDKLGVTHSNHMGGFSVLSSEAAVKDLLKEFDEIWNDNNRVKDVTNDVLSHIQKFYQENSPEWIYFVSLYHIFENQIGELVEDNIIKKGINFKDTAIWNKLYKFQQDGVIGAIDKIERYNGCILADSVGLGKTFSALAVIKYYELRNDRVLILCPKKLRDNWTIYTQNDKRNILEKDRFNYDVLHHTDLSRYYGYTGDINLGTINWSNYDLVVIDESHNFRNNSTSKKDSITRYQRLMQDIIKAGVKTKVMMLSATPVNNRMTDIKNQIAFITEGKDSALENEGISSIEYTLKSAQESFNRWNSEDPERRTTNGFIESVNPDYFKLLDLLTIARSRKHIEKYYKLSNTIKFPTRLDPKSIKSDIDIKREFPSIADVNDLIKELNLGVYRPLTYVLPNMRKKYTDKYDTVVKGGQSTFTQLDRETAIIGLVRVNLLKRMESSIHSFTLTLERLLGKINYILDKIDHFSSNGTTIEELNDLEDVDDDQLEDLMVGDKEIKILLKDMDLIKWKDALVDDKDKIETILTSARDLTSDRDQKLDDLKILIEEKLAHPINEGNKKIIIFTAFTDTAQYLYENMADKMLGKYNIHAALVSGSGKNKTNLKGVRSTDLNDILTNFSPIAKERNSIYPDMVQEIDLLIATDCISEGQNLQDCDYLINYDIHWNPVRVIQRFGRIDRIGSKNDVIQLVNFWPNMELDEYINLEQRVRGRMVLLDTSATGEENLLDTGSKEMNDLYYRKNQLEQLQTQVVDLEDVNGSISITDLTFNDYKMDLMEALKTQRKNLEKAPKGMYAIADSSTFEDAEPGVIFLLKQKAEDLGQENSILPYIMIYLREDGEAKLHYTQSKKILDYFKKLCQGNDKFYQELIDIFNEGTNYGSDMQDYSDLLREAIDIIRGKKEEVGLASLFSVGGTTLQTELLNNLEDVELISFLIIKEG